MMTGFSNRPPQKNHTPKNSPQIEILLVRCAVDSSRHVQGSAFRAYEGCCREKEEEKKEEEEKVEEKEEEEEEMEEKKEEEE